MSARHSKRVKRNAVRARAGSDTERYRGRAFTSELAVPDRDVMGVVVFAGCIYFAGCLGARHIDERVVVCCRVIGKLDILDGKSVCALISAIAVDIELSGDGLACAVNGQVQSCFLVHDRHFRDVRKQSDRHIACQLVRRIECSLEGRKVRCCIAGGHRRNDLGILLLNRHAVDRAVNCNVDLRLGADLPVINHVNTVAGVNRCIALAVFRECTRHDIRAGNLNIEAKQRVPACLFYIDRALTFGSVVHEGAVIDDYLMGTSAFTVDVQELACLLVDEGTTGVGNGVSAVYPHVVIAV